MEGQWCEGVCEPCYAVCHGCWWKQQRVVARRQLHARACACVRPRLQEEVHFLRAAALGVYEPQLLRGDVFDVPPQRHIRHLIDVVVVRAHRARERVAHGAEGRVGHVRVETALMHVGPTRNVPLRAVGGHPMQVAAGRLGLWVGEDLVHAAHVCGLVLCR